MERGRELDELKRKIDKQSNSDKNEPEYALQFDKDTYLSKGYVESAKWIKDIVAKNLTEKMNDVKNKGRFDALIVSKKASTYIGIRTCARYNRGEMCNFGKWHQSHRPEQQWSNPNTVMEAHSSYSATSETYKDHRMRRTGVDEQRPNVQDRLGRRNEVRLHACTLCMEAFGSANGHSVVNCPWIFKKNWQ